MPYILLYHLRMSILKSQMYFFHFEASINQTKIVTPSRCHIIYECPTTLIHAVDIFSAVRCWFIGPGRKHTKSVITRKYHKIQMAFTLVKETPLVKSLVISAQVFQTSFPALSVKGTKGGHIAVWLLGTGVRLSCVNLAAMVNFAESQVFIIRSHHFLQITAHANTFFPIYLSDGESILFLSESRNIASTMARRCLQRKASPNLRSSWYEMAILLPVVSWGYISPYKILFSRNW